MNKTLYYKELKNLLFLFFIFACIIAMYDIVIIIMFDPKLGDMLNGMAANMPELFSAFGMLDVGSTLVEFLANYLYGFLLVALPIVFIILMVNKILVKPMDNGSFSWILASGKTRKLIITTEYFVLFTEILLLNLFNFLLLWGTSEIIFPNELEVLGLIKISLGLFSLHWFLASLSFFSACFFALTPLASGFSTFLSILFLLIQMISKVNEKSEFLKNFTPFTLYNTMDILANHSLGGIGPIILAMLALTLTLISIASFTKKDLSL